MRPVRFLALAVTGAVLLSGCVASGRTSHPDSDPVGGAECPVRPDESIRTQVRIGWQGIVNGDLVVKDLGLLEKCMPNAQISWVRTKGGDDTIQAFGSRAIDLGIYGSSAAVKSLSPGIDLPLQVVWVGDVIGTSEALVARTDDIRSLKDLRGKNVAVVFGATPHYSLLAMLKAEGLEGQVNIINANNDSMLAGWRQGDLDAVWTWDPTLSELVNSGGHVVMTSADAAQRGVETYDIISARRDFIAANPDFLRMWTVAQDHAVTLLQQDPDRAAQSIGNQLGIPAAEARSQLGGYRYLRAKELAGEDYFGGKLPSKIRTQAALLAQVGLVPAAHDEAAYRSRVHADAVQEVGR